MITTQLVTVASGAVADHVDHESLEFLRPRVAGLDVRKMKLTPTVRPREPGMARPRLALQPPCPRR